MISARCYVCAVAAVALFAPRCCAAQDDVVDIAAREVRADDDPHKRYFMIGPRQGAEPPEDGYGLIVVLPGGDGSADFHPFVKRIYKFAVPEGYVMAQPIAVQWTAAQKIVWPCAKSKVAGMKFSTEQFVGAVIDDVSRQTSIDPARVFTVSWSSGGPAAYAVSLKEKKVRGALIAMSVYHPKELLPLSRAKDRAFYVYHSPEDRVCPYRMAEQATRELEKNGAKVKLATYDGGHGWQGPLYDDIGAGIAWLEVNSKH